MSVLVDEMSMSNSEVIAAAAQDLDRATVVGSPTPGLVLPSGVVRLPNGDGLLHAFAGYSRSSGGALEGAGVVPDVAAPPVRSALLAGIDPAIATAVAIMTEAPRTAVPD
jgi:carboxyl-terminal processing protease